MNTKKQQILASATDLFLENGFQKTSVQDIAENCNVSKATIYKLFSTKEDIAIAVVKYINSQMIYKIRDVQRKKDLDSIEKLKATIYLYITDYHLKRKFTDTLYFCFSPEQKEKFLPLMHRAHFEVFNEYAQSIKQAFNLPTEALSWELTFNMEGIIREVTLLECTAIISTNQAFVVNKEDFVDFVYDSLVAISERRIVHTPLIPEEKMLTIKDFLLNSCSNCEPSCQRTQLLEDLQKKITEDTPAGLHKDLLEAVSLIEDELIKSQPQKIVIHSLWLYLAQRDELSDVLDELKNILKLY